MNAPDRAYPTSPTARPLTTLEQLLHDYNSAKVDFDDACTQESVAIQRRQEAENFLHKLSERLEKLIHQNLENPTHAQEQCADMPMPSGNGQGQLGRLR
jgi:hypothetical protein